MPPSSFPEKRIDQIRMQEFLNKAEARPVPGDPNSFLINGKVFTFDSEADEVNIDKFLRDLLDQGSDPQSIREFLLYFGLEEF